MEMIIIKKFVICGDYGNIYCPKNKHRYCKDCFGYMIISQFDKDYE